MYGYFWFFWKGSCGTYILVAGAQSIISQADWKTTFVYFASGIVLNSVAFSEMGESIHKFKLGGDLRDEARSLRAALDRHLLETVTKRDSSSATTLE